jgi:hypothetical protein
MPRHHQPTRRVNPKPSIIPAALVDDKVRCPGCSAVVTPTPNGHVRQHNAPSGEPCAIRTVVAGERVKLAELPDVSFRPGQDPREPRPERPKREWVPGRYVKVTPPPPEVVARNAGLAPRTGYCVEDGCEKFIGPDRTLCGQHAANRARPTSTANGRRTGKPDSVGGSAPGAPHAGSRPQATPHADG